MTQPLDWEAAAVKRIADEIKRRRGDRSAQWLSDRTAELGRRVSRATISDMEVGRRTRLEVTELMVIAQALGVPPIRLLFPGHPEDDAVEYLPGETVTTAAAIDWFTGEVADHVSPENRTELRVLEMGRENRRRLRWLLKELDRAIAKTDEVSPETDEYEDWVKAATEAVEAVRTQRQQLDSIHETLRGFRADQTGGDAA
ncbi:hypothetical protein [Nocardia fluminea]|uniref:hypothetical protein n=1 Tax=Nocardia fluminea TaxID=134984 RepID=UPI003D099F37